MQTSQHTAYLALGTNLGDKEQNVAEALRLIEEQIGHVCAQSALLHSAPVGFESDNMFVNAACRVCTSLTPMQLLDATQRIERQMGRTQKSHNRQYHDRIIDIDILLYDDISINTEVLTIPHPLMYERDFVMIPLSQVREK